MASIINEGSVVTIRGTVRKVHNDGEVSLSIEGLKENGDVLILTDKQAAASGVVIVASVFKLEDMVTHKVNGGKGYIVGQNEVNSYLVAWVRNNRVTFEMAAGDLLIPYWPEQVV